MVQIPNEKLINIVGTLNYARSLLADKEPNEIIDDLDEVITFLDNFVVIEDC